MAQNRVIGRDNTIPWRLPADLKHFKTITMGHTVILGRKTFDSIGKALSGRRWIVLTRQRDWRCSGVEVAHDLDDALRMVTEELEVFVAGGADVYRQALPRADRLYLTVIHTDIEGDARFPELDMSRWKQLEDQPHAPDDRNTLAYSFRRYERR